MSQIAEHAKSIFLEAVEKHTPDDWPKLLDQACGDDDKLRQRVEGLLQAHAEEDSLFDAADPTADYRPLEQTGQVIGPYKLRERLGVGGMGVVWAAERKKPIRLKVALKVIKPGMDSEQVIARFEAEREALAMMDHPNIARVLDAGTTEQGRPYFVMELIRGVPITEYCDAHGLTVPERLKLFIQVCKAVQHAHSKLIVHRDIKPSNVLVTEHDGTPVPKVIDFGVAKALHQPLTDRSIYTSVFQAIGTLAYMAPEQAGLSGKGVDTCADVYGLGVLLYELLTGTTPFDRQQLKQAAFDEALRIIREEDAPNPSKRISTLGDNLTVTHGRRKDPEELGRIVSGDLDCIVMKALEKDRGQRYGTADAFADDIERHLSNEPVAARPPSAAYRLSRFYRRNKAGVRVATAMVALLVLGLVGTALFAVDARTARDGAIIAKNQAEEAEELAEEAEERATTALVAERSVRKRLGELNYARTMSAAFAALENANPELALDLLKSLREDNERHELGIEWRLLFQQIRRTVGNARRHDVGKTYKFCQLSFSNDGKRLAIPIPNRGVKLVDTQTGVESWLLNDPAHRDGLRPLCVAFSPNKNVLAVGMGNQEGQSAGALQLFDLDNDKEHAKITKSLDFEAWSIKFSPEGKQLVVLSKWPGVDRFIALLDTDSLVEAWPKRAISQTSSVVFTPDGRFLIATHGSIGMTVWDRATGKRELGDHVKKVTEFPAFGIQILPDAKTMITSAENRRVFWHIERFEPFAVESVDPGHMRLALSSQEPRVLASKQDRCSIEVADWGTGIVLRTIQDKIDIQSFAISPAGTHLATLSLAGDVKLWDLTPSGYESCAIALHWFLPVQVLADDAVALPAKDGKITIWNPGEGHVEPRSRHDARQVSAFARLPDGLLAVGSFASNAKPNGLVQVWNPQSWELIWDNEFEAGSVWALAFSETTNMLAVGGRKGAIEIREFPSFELVRTLTVSNCDAVRSLAFSRDGRYLLSGGGTNDGGDVILWDSRTFNAVWQQKRSNRVDSVAFSPNGSLFVAADRAGHIQLRAAEDPDVVVFERKGRGSYVASVCFNSEGDRLVCAAVGEIIIYRVPDGEEVARWKTPDSVRRVALFDDDSAIISAGANGLARIWPASHDSTAK